MHKDSPPARGRRRSEGSRSAILEATAALLEERGYTGLTIEAVAARAGVGKQTIYRWWPGRAGLVMEAYAHLASRRVREPNTGSVAGDLRQLLSRAFAALAGTGSGKALAGLMAEAQADETLAEEFRAHFIEVRRGVLRAILRRGQDRGEVRAGLDLEVAVDALYGAMWYRLLLGHGRLDSKFARQLAQLVTEGLLRRDG